MLRPLVFLPLVFLFLSACASSTTPAPLPPHTLTVADDNHTVSIPSGQVLHVVLDGNGSTGYQWKTASVDPTILTPQGEPTYSPTSSLPGSGGTYTFSFLASSPGQTVLVLQYARSWEVGVPPSRTFQVTIVVT